MVNLELLNLLKDHQGVNKFTKIHDYMIILASIHQAGGNGAKQNLAYELSETALNLAQGMPPNINSDQVTVKRLEIISEYFIGISRELVLVGNFSAAYQSLELAGEALIPLMPYSPSE